jgi:hypothetical protein
VRFPECSGGGQGAARRAWEDIPAYLSFSAVCGHLVISKPDAGAHHRDGARTPTLLRRRYLQCHSRQVISRRCVEVYLRFSCLHRIPDRNEGPVRTIATECARRHLAFIYMPRRNTSASSAVSAIPQARIKRRSVLKKVMFLDTLKSDDIQDYEMHDASDHIRSPILFYDRNKPYYE